MINDARDALVVAIKEEQCARKVFLKEASEGEIMSSTYDAWKGAERRRERAFSRLQELIGADTIIVVTSEGAILTREKAQAFKLSDNS